MSKFKRPSGGGTAQESPGAKGNSYGVPNDDVP